ncbi:hypothetical protein E2C01_017473 [Portunus trituberculatus]|uniref:Uncharacterized protein n=1 Tax=Portunus trituberculatus TaxID=210409 RepID=A0A5B7DRT9_PORTR|nr:hypothetical protein [Portunus trituberculatus]
MNRVIKQDIEETNYILVSMDRWDEEPDHQHARINFTAVVGGKVEVVVLFSVVYESSIGPQLHHRQHYNPTTTTTNNNNNNNASLNTHHPSFSFPQTLISSPKRSSHLPFHNLSLIFSPDIPLPPLNP